jgi:hypothetical protein
MPAEPDAPVPAPAAPAPDPGDKPAPGAPSTEMVCPLCAGGGTVDNNGIAVVCPECQGSGRVALPSGHA